jgi:transposase
MLTTAMIYVLRTGCAWRAVPPDFGPWGTVYSRWRLWCSKGVWEKILKYLARGRTGALRFIDSTHLKVHQDAHGGCGGKELQAIGKSRGGLNSKLHAVVDGKGRLVRASLTPGNVHDAKAAPDLLAGLRGVRIVGDKAYDSGPLRDTIRRSRSRHCIPSTARRKIPAPFHQGYYRHRRHVENFFQRIKRNRRIATRYDKLADTYFNFILLAACLDWLATS